MHLIWYLSACKESIIGREISPPLHLIHRHLQISRCPARPNPIIAKSPGINLRKSGWEIIPAKESLVSTNHGCCLVNLQVYATALIYLLFNLKRKSIKNIPRELTILKTELSESFTDREIPTETNSLFLSKN